MITKSSCKSHSHFPIFTVSEKPMFLYQNLLGKGCDLNHNNEQAGFVDENEEKVPTESAKKDSKQNQRKCKQWDGTRDYTYPDPIRTQISEMSFHEQLSLIKTYTTNIFSIKKKRFK